MPVFRLREIPRARLPQASPVIRKPAKYGGVIAGEWVENANAHSGRAFSNPPKSLNSSPKILAEKISRLPLRTLRILRNVVAHQEIDLHEFDCGVQIQWLIHIVRRSVVAGRHPSLHKLLPVYPR